MASSYPQLVLFGDSLLQQCITVQNGFSFQAELQNHLLRRVDVVNRGFSGWTTSHALEYLPQIIPKRVEGSGKIDYLVILFGANDSVLDLPTTRQHVPLEQYKKNLTDIINHPHVVAHKPKILLVTPPPVDQIKVTGLNIAEGHSQAIRTQAISAGYSKMTQEVARENPGVESIDLWTAIMNRAIEMSPNDYQAGGPWLGSPENGKQGGLDILLPDGLHMGGEAYKVFLSILLPHIGQEWVGLDEYDRTGYVYPDWRVLTELN